MRKPVPNQWLEFGEFRLDAGRRLLFRKGSANALDVTPKVVETILLFARHPQELLDKDRLMRELWPNVVVEESSLTQVISASRRTLGEARGENRYIATVPGRGYRFVAEVVSAAAAEDPPATAPTPAAPAAPDRARRAGSATLITLLVLGAGAVAGYLLFSRPPAPRSANPLDDAAIRRFTDLPGNELDPAISADGKLIAFLSDRGGVPDVWVGGVAGGDFINLTKGRFARMHMDQLHTVGFNADGTRAWFRAFERNAAGQDVPNVWLVPVTGGAPQRFLDNTTHVAWSPEGSRIVYQQYTAGDPLYVAAADGSAPRMIFVDEPGWHCHMLSWSPDGKYIYFVRGPHPTREMDVWRVAAAGGAAERLTEHNARVGYPTPLDDRTLLYTAMPAESTVTALFALDLATHATRRVNTGIEEYPTVSSGSGAMRDRLVATVSNPMGTLFTVPVSTALATEADVRPVQLPVAHAVAPRFGPGYLLYLSSRHGAYGLDKLAGGAAIALWRGDEGGLIGPPSVAPDGSRIAFAVRAQGRNRLHVVNADGSAPRPLAPTFDVLDAGTWSADGKWLAVTARDAAGSRVYTFAVDDPTTAPVGRTERLTLLPQWAPDGSFFVYSQSLGGPGYLVRAATPDGKPHDLPELWVPRGGDRYRFTADGFMVLLLEENGRQNFWRYDPRTGARRQLTDLAQGAAIRNFDVDRDGTRIIFDRIRDNADIVLIDLVR